MACGTSHEDADMPVSPTFTLREFARDRRGNFAMLTAIALTGLTMAAGMAVDLSQAYHLKSGLRSALDAALTSTAYDITTGRIKVEDARASVEKFLRSNGNPAFAVQNEFMLGDLKVDRTARTIAATAYANVDLAFPVFNMTDPRVSIDGAALYSDKQIEVAMMLDVTGSMKGQKIKDLKTAAENAVKEMLKNQDPKNPRVRVALVPYASSVNTGELSNTVFAESARGSDLPPLATDKLFAKLRLAPNLPSFIDYTSIISDASETTETCATERKTRSGAADFSSDGPDTVRTDANGKKYYALVNRDDVVVSDKVDKSMNTCPDAKIIPLTADSDALLDSIDEFKANGYTAGAIAVQWTYYMLSPKWRAVIKDARLGSGPTDHNARKIAKVAILMTDGQFNTAFAGVASKFNAQDPKARSNAEAICTNMKADGIEVYTIGFDLDSRDMTPVQRAAAKAVLRNCASTDTSSAKHYFETSTGDELNEAFQAIIRNQEKIALTK
jgi:Flp pilus assembly protein TadG